MMHYILMCAINAACSHSTDSRVNIFSLQAFSRQSEDWITDLNLTAAVAKNLILPHVKLHTALNNNADFLLVCDILETRRLSACPHCVRR